MPRCAGTPAAGHGPAGPVAALYPPAAIRERRGPPDGAAEDPLDPRVLDELRRIAGSRGDALVTRVARLYLAETPGRVAQMRTAAGAGDARALREVAHGLKASSAAIGAMPLAALCRDLEAIGRDGTVDGAAPLVERADDELGRVVAVLADSTATRI